MGLGGLVLKCELLDWCAARLSSLELLLKMQTPRLYTRMSDSGRLGFSKKNQPSWCLGTPQPYNESQILGLERRSDYLKMNVLPGALVAYATTSPAFSSHSSSAVYTTVTDGDDSDHSTPKLHLLTTTRLLWVLWASHTLPAFLPWKPGAHRLLKALNGLFCKAKLTNSTPLLLCANDYTAQRDDPTTEHYCCAQIEWIRCSHI